MTPNAAVHGNIFQRIRVPGDTQVRRDAPRNPRRKFLKLRSVDLFRFRVPVESHCRRVKLALPFHAAAEHFRSQRTNGNPPIRISRPRPRILETVIRHSAFFYPKFSVYLGRRGRTRNVSRERHRAVIWNILHHLAGVKGLRPRNQAERRLLAEKADASSDLRPLTFSFGNSRQFHIALRKIRSAFDFPDFRIQHPDFALR